MLSDEKAKNKVVQRNPSASLYDVETGRLSSIPWKNNAIDDGVVNLYEEALNQLDEGKWEALVVKSRRKALSVREPICSWWRWQACRSNGINSIKWWPSFRKSATEPCIPNDPSSPRREAALGGGCENFMQSAATQAAGETYIGLVEVGVGVLPAGGGCKEMLARTLGHIPKGTDYDPNPFVQAVFKNIGMAEVAKSAEEARDIGYLRPLTESSLVLTL